MPTQARKVAPKKPTPRPTPARAPRSRAASQSGSPEANKALVRRFLEHGLSKEARTNPEVLHEYFADHFVDHVRVHHEIQGVHGVKDAVADLHNSTHSFQMSVAHLVAEGDWVAVHWQATSRRHRALTKHRQLKNVEPSGDERTAAGITLFRLAGGKITESWNYDNALELAMQNRNPAAA